MRVCQSHRVLITLKVKRKRNARIEETSFHSNLSNFCKKKRNARSKGEKQTEKKNKKKKKREKTLKMSTKRFWKRVAKPIFRLRE